MNDIRIGMEVRVRNEIKQVNILNITQSMYESQGEIFTVRDILLSSQCGYIYMLSNGWKYLREWFVPVKDVTLYDLVE